MMTTGIGAGPFSEAEQSRQLRRAAVSVIATSFLPDYTNLDISQEHDAPEAPAAGRCVAKAPSLSVPLTERCR